MTAAGSTVTSTNQDKGRGKHRQACPINARMLAAIVVSGELRDRSIAVRLNTIEVYPTWRGNPCRCAPPSPGGDAATPAQQAVGRAVTTPAQALRSATVRFVGVHCAAAARGAPLTHADAQLQVGVACWQRRNNIAPLQAAIRTFQHVARPKLKRAHGR
jgi:hypothetical protein